jgi:hypothetical protein
MRRGLQVGLLMLGFAGCGERNVVVADREGDAGGGAGLEGGSGGSGNAGTGGSIPDTGGSTQTGGTGTGATGGSSGNAGAGPGGSSGSGAGGSDAGGSGAEGGSESGQAGMGAGTGGNDDGGAGEAGAGTSSGGAPGRDCATIVTDYGDTLREAQACSPNLTVEQCTLLVPANTGCDCMTFVNPANADAVERLEALADEVSPCDRPCPTTCHGTARGVCGSGTADYGICYGTN